jgi:AcrR family transcriptional regulator
MNRSRARMLQAARDLLLKGGIAVFNIDAVARRAKVTRQTVHNQFGTRSELLEALFDQVAQQGGMEGIAASFRQPDPASALAEYIKVFARFWASDRQMTRRIHGLAAVDSDLGKILAARQERRVFGCRNLMTMLSRRYGQPRPEEIETAARVLYSLTSFEFFDALAGAAQPPEEVAGTISTLMYSFLGLS